MWGHIFQIFIPVYLQLYYDRNSLQFLRIIDTFYLLEQGCVLLFLSDGREDLLLWNSLERDIFYEGESLALLMVTL